MAPEGDGIEVRGRLEVAALKAGSRAPAATPSLRHHPLRDRSCKRRNLSGARPPTASSSCDRRNPPGVADRRRKVPPLFSRHRVLPWRGLAPSRASPAAGRNRCRAPRGAAPNAAWTLVCVPEVALSRHWGPSRCLASVSVRIPRRRRASRHSCVLGHLPPRTARASLPLLGAMPNSSMPTPAAARRPSATTASPGTPVVAPKSPHCPRKGIKRA